MIMAVIFPAHGKEAEVARTLLAMADDVKDVLTNTDSGLAFHVPEYLYQRYLNNGTGAEEVEAEQTEEVIRRRPGRPRKAQPEPAKEGD